MSTMTQNAANTADLLNQAALAAVKAQIAANPRADEVRWSLCNEAAQRLGLKTASDDNLEKLEEAVGSYWGAHKRNPAPVGGCRPYAKDGSNGIPGWFAVCDHRGHYGSFQLELRSDADVYCYWRTQDLPEGQGSFCPALIQEDGSTTCDI
ncbi:hypothetical protein [Sphingomonas sp. 3-13AW]|uniref:hypothetical protein n=1 Tax=Sphingomonas sp. 3-13AW TaxID=3050450 RepID=UPI003BB5A0A4